VGEMNFSNQVRLLFVPFENSRVSYKYQNPIVNGYISFNESFSSIVLPHNQVELSIISYQSLAFSVHPRGFGSGSQLG